MFNGKYYDQIDGVGMGSPLGPLFPNIFLSHHEQKKLENCTSHFKPAHYRRYLDESLTFSHLNRTLFLF